MNRHAGQHNERQNPPRRIAVERQGAQGHQHHLDRLHHHNNGTLTEPIGKDAGKDGHKNKRQDEHDKGESRLRMGGGFEFRARSHLRGQLPDGQQRHHQLPGIVIERPKELGHKKTAKG